MAAPGTFPPRLTEGDELRVIAPARSHAIIGEPERQIARGRLEDELGLRVSFGTHVEEIDAFGSTAVRARLADLHDAFADPAVAGILTVIGGFNSNQLLPYIDWDLIAGNPKVLCGYSDISALNNAVFARSGLVTYSGPHYSTFGMKLNLEPTLEWFRACLFDDQPIELSPAPSWTDDAWYLDQDDRHEMANEGWWVLAEGTSRGTIVGGNLSTLSLLFGTPHMPSLEATVLFTEDDFESQPHHFDRQLAALTQQGGFDGVGGLVIGRFQGGSNMSRELLAAIVASKRELDGLPIVANVDFGHTNPLVTYPIGGEVELAAGREGAAITITRH